VSSRAEPEVKIVGEREREGRRIGCPVVNVNETCTN